MKERKGDPIPRLAHAYTELLREYSGLLQRKGDPKARARREELMSRLAELNGRLEALQLDES